MSSNTSFNNIGIINDVKPISDQDVRLALAEFVDGRCCYGYIRGEHLMIKEILMQSCFVYKLESFTERRDVKRVYTAYYGGNIDGPSNGNVNPYSMPVCPPAYFANGKKTVRVPHTEEVETCHICDGCGYTSCYACDLFGNQSCSSCCGSGRRDDENCSWCCGSGSVTCSSCSGTRRITCSSCYGEGKLLWYRQLKLKWDNYVDFGTVNGSAVPDDKIVKSKGDIVIQDRYPRVREITYFPVVNVNHVSSAVIAKHEQSSFENNIIEQRHTVIMTPVAEIYYKWKSKEGVFNIYGNDHSVLFKDYPLQCCFGFCSIL